MSRWRVLMLTTSAILPIGLAPAYAGPNGASVVAGSATVQGQGTASVVVNQSSQSAIINWNTFNIGAGESTKINMPGANSVELDRVTGGLGPSQILGSLTSNGNVFLVNRDGILFDQGAKVNVGGLLATTNDIANSDFMAGRYNFSIPGSPSASVVNQGSITAQTGGFAALVAPGVRNAGTIAARLGTIALASGNAFTLDFYGDNLLTLGLSDSIAANVTDVSTGQPLSSLVTNSGTLKANGGTVQLTAVAARQVVDSVINNAGVVEANSVGTHNGIIVLSAATAASKPPGAPTQTVKVSGTLSAAGKRKGTTGGTIEATGENVEVAGATINASGRSGGGTVLIGGDWGGGNPNQGLISNPSAYLQPYAVPTATTTSVDAATSINASATGAGNGGKVIVWSNAATTFYGMILAQGGAQSGDGGFVETSGHVLAFDGARVDTSAAEGASGSWLLDPYDLTIDASAASTISTDLASSNVTIETTASGASGPGIQNSSGNGDILVNANIAWNSANDLTLSAYRNIDIASGVTISNSTSAQPAGNIDLPILVLRADNSGTDTGTVSFNGTSKIDFSGANNGLTYAQIFYNPIGGYSNPTVFSSHFVGQSFVPLGLIPSMLVNNVTDLQNIQNNLSGDYALGKDFDASGVNFTPIGSAATPFTGRFQGADFDIGEATIPTLGRTISNLSINSSLADVGLFGYNSGLLYGFTLSNASVTANGSGALNVGAVAGQNSGTIQTVSSSGAVQTTGADNFQHVGGLVGENDGFLFFLSSSASVSTQGGANDNGFYTFGGLAGSNNGTIDGAFATGAVLANNGSSGDGGGFVGKNNGSIAGSFSNGTVTANGNVGGFVGWNQGGQISQSYETGAVSVGASSTAAAFVQLDDLGGSITQSYATGHVTAGQPAAGLVESIGFGGGFVTSSYWDTQSTGQLNSAAGSPSPPAALKNVIPVGFDPTAWATNPSINNGYPYLIDFPPPTGASGSTSSTSPPPSLPPAQNQIISNQSVTGNSQVNSMPSTITINAELTDELTRLLSEIPGISQQEISNLISDTITTALQNALFNSSQINEVMSAFASNLESANTNLSGPAQTLITDALIGALTAEMQSSGYSPYLIQPTSFVVTLALNNAFAVMSPDTETFGGPVGAALFATIQTTAGELVQTGEAGVGLWTDIQAVRDDFAKLNQSVQQLDAMASQARAAGNRAASVKLAKLAETTETTISNLRQEYTVFGVSILDNTSAWNVLSVFAH
jgi:filamentous hemagglutinin family protein